MKSLGISKKEAEQLIEDDENDFIGEEGEAMTQKAKENRHREESGKERRKSTRENKIDPVKMEIIMYLRDAMERRHVLIEENEWDFSDVFIKNAQKEITFSVDGCEYSLNLVKHRQKK